MKAIRIKSKNERGRKALLTWLNFGKNLTRSQKARYAIAKGMSNYKLEIVTRDTLTVDYSDRFMGIMGNKSNLVATHIQSVKNILESSDFGAEDGDLELDCV